MAAILKNGCHFFPAEYRQGCPPRSCAGRSPEHVDTQHVFTTAHVRWTPKTGFCPLGICLDVSGRGWVAHLCASDALPNPEFDNIYV